MGRGKVGLRRLVCGKEVEANELPLSEIFLERLGCRRRGCQTAAEGRRGSQWEGPIVLSGLPTMVVSAERPRVRVPSQGEMLGNLEERFDGVPLLEGQGEDRGPGASGKRNPTRQVEEINTRRPPSSP